MWPLLQTMYTWWSSTVDVKTHIVLGLLSCMQGGIYQPYIYGKFAPSMALKKMIARILFQYFLSILRWIDTPYIYSLYNTIVWSYCTTPPPLPAKPPNNKTAPGPPPLLGPLDLLYWGLPDWQTEMKTNTTVLAE